MKNFIKNFVQHAATKFPSVFLDYLRNKLETSELKNSSLYEITKVAYSATSLEELYKSIHQNISKLMYADNIFIALHDKKDDLIRFPYYVDKYDDFHGQSFPFDDSLLTCNCINEGTPVLFNKEELTEYLNGSSKGDKEIIS